MVPFWLTFLSWISLAGGVVSAAVIALDLVGHPQKMPVMSLVWPLCALFAPGLMVWAYFAWGRRDARSSRETGHAGTGHGGHGTRHKAPFPAIVAKGALHCGSGCALGDVIAETLLVVAPGIAVVFGFGWLFPDKMFAGWVLDFVIAFLIGIGFQYFAIAPMRGLGWRDGIVAALKADTLSLAAWQVGMYAYMAVAQFWLFGALLGLRLEASQPEFWLMMQIAMLCGFATSYPVNWWLIRTGLKEPM